MKLRQYGVVGILTLQLKSVDFGLHLGYIPRSELTFMYKLQAVKLFMTFQV